MEGYSIRKKFSLTSVFLLSAILCINCDVGNYKDAACHDHEREALVKFRSGLEYDSYHQVASWDQITGDCCQWRGVECDAQTGYVLQLHLFPDLLCHDHDINWYSFYNNTGRLDGQLDPVLLKLEYLRFLDLSGNAFIGMPIPEFLGSFKDLLYLNLSYSQFVGRIPHQLGNLSNLEQLDIHGSLSYNDIGAQFDLSTNSLHWLKGMPMLRTLRMGLVDLSEVGNDWIQVLNDGFPSLHELELSECELGEIAPTITSINFNSLRKLNLYSNNIVSKFPSWIANISSLESVDLSWNGFHGPIPHDLSELPHLKQLHLRSPNNLTGNCTTLLQGAWRSIESLDFSSNQLYGQLPSSIGNLTSLILLDLSNANIEGLPETVTNPCSFVIQGSYCHETTPLSNLRVLNLWGNYKISGTIPNWLGKLRSLEELDMSNCNLSGPIPPNFGDLSSLRTLNLENNHLTGILPMTTWNLTRLEYLSLENNHLSGIIPTTTWNLSRLEWLFLGKNSLMGYIADAQLNQLKKLTHLDLSSNSFVFHLSSHWVPPFQLKFLNLEACSLGPSFPQWLITQKSLSYLVLSNTSIEDSLPPWFWDFVNPALYWLDLSHNKIKGLLPKTWNCSSPHLYFDLSSNQFFGPLPQTYFAPLPEFFFISDNNITGTIPNSICDVGGSSMVVMNLSQNHIFGNIPAGLGNCTRLIGLDLSENHLVGVLPSAFSKLGMLASVHLGNNNLSGTIPSSLNNYSSLEVLDLDENNLSGNLSPLIHITELRILRLRSNKFTGALPPNISSMDYLQILDLSDNMLSGLIPKSIGKFAAMTMNESALASEFPISYIKAESYDPLSDTLSASYAEKLWMSFKGNDLLYDKNLGHVAGIDLSRNDFYGEIPEELMRLKGLVFLNLSNNCFTGMIPKNIGELRMLESLDISSNELEGEIPSSLSLLTFLAKLNLSNNHLRGRIPSGGQLQILGDSYIYEGNIGLCGPPLERQCADNNTIPPTQDLDHGKKDDETRLLYMGMMFGFIFGFWVFWGFLIFNKSTRNSSYKFLDAMMDKSLLLILICLEKVKIRL